MTCAEFLDRYTDYRDGLVTAPRELRRFARHLAQCPSCRSHDAALRHGLLALQDERGVGVSSDFRARLERRLERERARREPSLATRAPLAAALFVAVAVALLAIEGVSRNDGTRVPALPAVPFPKPVAQAGVPFVSFQDPRSSVVISNPNPYGTALIEPIAAGH